MKLYLAQLNPIVGDLQGNLEKLQGVLEGNSDVDLVVFPELFLTGYPPQDLLRKKGFLKSVVESVQQVQDLSKNYPRVTLILGTPWPQGEKLFNAALCIRDGEILAIQQKRVLSPFRGFAEATYFSPGEQTNLIKVADRNVAVALGLELDGTLASKLREARADVIVNPVAIPFRVGDLALQHASLRQIAQEAGIPVLRVGQVGGNDDLIFAGGSLAIDDEGWICALAEDFKEMGLLVDLAASKQELTGGPEDETAQVYEALVLGLRDYVHKSGMKKALIGLSGGLDSAVSAVLACAALGPENVWGITQPGPYSSPESALDAKALAENLGMRLDILNINDLYQEALHTLDEFFAGTAMNVAEENIQARLRGNLLMALSNKFGGMVLTNSNKSELAVGYCTLYGDMSGGLAPIADVYKTGVYQLAYYINRAGEIIPWNTIEKPPSAELRPDQRDDETLPPYDILDGILKLYLDGGRNKQEIIEQGYAEETVHWVLRTVDGNDYKRKQAALILRVTSPVFGEERKLPFAARKDY